MGNLVIVAIPNDQDRVWKISSEEVPHLTLLFLGDAENNPDVNQIMQFVQHATQLSEHGPFYLDVDRRGELGDDKADVLFFSKRSWNLKWIKQFRSQLLQNEAVRKAYDSAGQLYPEWLPHLTLGYPETPAKKSEEDDDRPIYSVEFDRIAVWTGNFEGPEFRLEWSEREDEMGALAYHDAGQAAVADILHYGVKGMRWGQRKATSVVEKPTSTMTRNQKIAIGAFGGAAVLANKGVREAYRKDVALNKGFQKDKKWEKDFQKAKGFGFDDQKFTKDYNNKWKDSDFSKEDWDNPSPTYKKYIDGYFKEMNTAYSKQFADHFGDSPSGKYEAHHVPGTDLVKLRKKDTAQHADEVLVTFRIKRDDKGLIIGLEQVEDEMAQTADLGAEFLEHYGVKGMRWGVRNRKGEPVAVSPSATSRVPHGKKRKTKIETEGGENHPASDDAIKVAKSKAKLKKSGAAALSNQELRDLADRLRLEDQVRELAAPKGQKFVKGLLKDQGKSSAKAVVRETVEAKTGFGGGKKKKK